jgi:A/G-specific adenine glycosylase
MWLNTVRAKDTCVPVALPFGQTAVDPETVVTESDVSTVSQILAESGIEDADDRVRKFLCEVPRLLTWLSKNGREYPWRFTTEPWHVYISEILLQRTRGDAVEQIYSDFFDRFPDPETLYQATDDEIHSTVASLGFGNHRTRTLGEVAELCVCEHGGEVPTDLAELQRPWRVGTYSARACLLFAYGEPQGLVDVNTARIISRVFGYEMPSQPHKSNTVQELLDALVPEAPGIARAFSFALLDLGALICTEPEPACESCPLVSECLYATESGRV